MTLADVNIAVLSEGDHHRLPQQPLSPGFIPISAASPHTDRHEKPPLWAELHHCGAVGVGDPDIVLCIDGHAVRLLLVTDHVIADLQNQFAIRVKLVELRTAGSLPLKDPEVAL